MVYKIELNLENIFFFFFFTKIYWTLTFYKILLNQLYTLRNTLLDHDYLL